MSDLHVFIGKPDPKRHCTGYKPLTGHPRDEQGRLYLAWQYGEKSAPNLFDK